MAIFRKIHVTFWSDPMIMDLTPEQKYFYLYLLTNSHTKQCGIYEISVKKICSDTGYNSDTIYKLLAFFIKKGRIKHNEKTNEIAIKNWAKYNDSNSPKVKSCIQKELKDVKDTVLIEYIYSSDTHTQEEQEEEQDPEEEIAAKADSLENRKGIFYDSLISHKDKYSNDLIEAFFNYWSEHNPNGKKMRFEMEKVFDISKRLITWAKRDFNKTKTTGGVFVP